MYVTYKIVCEITKSFYIGSHKTNDPNDNYMGSGKLIKDSILKYGLENHHKEILGVFETRKESVDLEHNLIKEMKRKQPDYCLNLSFGGESFDYINTNLKLDRSTFAKLASHKHSTEQKKKNMDEYNTNPKRCAECGKNIPYNKRYNKFCSSSCAAIYNNHARGKCGVEERTCKYCGENFSVRKKDKKLFCSISCAVSYNNANREMTKLQAHLLEDLGTIKKRRETESYRKIAKDYNISGNYLRHFLKTKVGD